jgi:DNA-binding SARP family transcriptional activator/tetratricopeptide (TPR) repeat protein
MRCLARAFTLPRRQARALLFRLAVNGQPVSREELADLFWPDKPPATARRNLTRLLSYLRRQLPQPDLLRINKTGVSLQPDLMTSDVIQFTELCQTDDTADWETAVSLYRGPFLAGFTLNNSAEFDNWLSRQQRQLEELYLETLRRLVVAYANKPSAAIQFAQKYLAIDDLAEDIHRQLITLYAANGNRSAALKQYEACVIILERELGVSPLPETRAAYEAAHSSQQITADEASPLPEWATLPGADLPLAGREAELTSLDEAYARLQNGGVIFITGEAGMGKSRLMQTFATARNALVLSGNSYPEGSAIPYQPIVQALRQALPLHGRWQHTSPIWLAELSRLLPEMHMQFPNLPALVEVDPQQAQARIYEALRQLFNSLATESPILLCLDDVHWADESTKGWLHYFTRQLRGSQVCILATYRAHEQQSINSWQWALKQKRLMTMLELGGLSETAVLDLLHQSDTKLPRLEQLAHRIHKATAGNPFFVLETIRELMARDEYDENSASLPLSPTVRDAVLHRASDLTPLARQILEVTAILSPIATLDIIAEAAGRDKLETATALEELTHRQLLRTGNSQFEIQHDLARETIYQEISPWRRQLLHRRVGNALGQKHADWPEAVAGHRAHHYDAAGAHKQAVESYEMAAQAAQAVYAHEEAVRYLQRAIDLLPEMKVASGQFVRLYHLLGWHLAILGRMETAREAFRQAIALEMPENVTNLAQLHWRIAKTYMQQLYYDKAEVQLNQALAILNAKQTQHDETWQPIWLDIQMDRLTLYAYLVDIDRFDMLVQKVSPILERTDWLEKKIELNYRLVMMKLLKERYRPSPETLGLVKDTLALTLTTNNLWVINSFHFLMGYTMFHASDLNSAEKYLHEALTQAKHLSDQVMEARCVAILCSTYRRLGDLERTAEYAQLAGEKGAAVGSHHFVAHSLANFAWLAYHNSEMAIARKKAQKASQDFLRAKIPFSWIALMVLLAVYVDKQELDQAVEAAMAILDPIQQRMPDNLEAALTTAVTAWQAGDEEITRDCLVTAVDLAIHYGYL